MGGDTPLSHSQPAPTSPPPMALQSESPRSPQEPVPRASVMSKPAAPPATSASDDEDEPVQFAVDLGADSHEGTHAHAQVQSGPRYSTISPNSTIPANVAHAQHASGDDIDPRASDDYSVEATEGASHGDADGDVEAVQVYFDVTTAQPDNSAAAPPKVPLEATNQGCCTVM